MDAFSEFRRLWNDPNSPFAYLKAPAITTGRVWPENTVTPLLSFNFLSSQFLPHLTYASRNNRHQSWPSISTVPEGLRENNLGRINQVRYAQAFDFRFQLDHWCQRPDTQALFLDQLYQAFRESSAGTQQTWIPIPYPPTHGRQMVRMRLEGDPQNMTEATQTAPNDVTVLYHTSCTLIIEGYRPDRNVVTVPTVWYLTLGVNFDGLDNLSPADMNTLYLINNHDLRADPDNPIVRLRQATMPPLGGSYSGSGTLGY
jgi:hypothetical protein